jgi:hypothetical protein
MSYYTTYTMPTSTATTFVFGEEVFQHQPPPAQPITDLKAIGRRVQVLLDQVKDEQPRLSSLATKTPFNYTCGIELTFVPEVYNELTRAMEKNHDHKEWDRLSQRYKGIAESLVLGNTTAIHPDPGCIEYPSPILESWKQAHAWYGVATIIGKNLGLVPFQEDQEGGMGHIHIGLSKEQVAYIHADLVARPYLTWIFATPNGSQYCKSLARSYLKQDLEPRFPLKGSEFVQEGHRIRPDSNIYDIFTTWNTLDFNGGNYEHEITTEERHGNLYALTDDRFSIAPYNYFHGTMEWRAFDAAATWKEQEEHLAFLQRYTWSVLSNADNFPAAPWGPGLPRAARNKVLQGYIDAYRKNKDACVREFKDLIVNTLELPWSRYKWYLERNLDAAFEWGKRY